MRKNLKINWKKLWLKTRFSVLDIAIIAILTTMFVVLSFLKQHFFTGKLNIEFIFIFAAILGILLGPVKGSVAAFILDLISLIIKGSIVQWMPEYALTSPLCALIAALLYRFFLNKNVFFLALAVFLITFILLTSLLVSSNQTWSIERFEGYGRQSVSLKFAAAIIYIWLFLYFISIVICYFIYKKNRSQWILHFVFSCAVIFLIYVLVRWIWGPFAFIRYARVWLNRKNLLNWNYYFTIMSGIILKSFFIIPLGIFLLTYLIPAINFSRKRYLQKMEANKTKKILQQKK